MTSPSSRQPRRQAVSGELLRQSTSVKVFSALMTFLIGWGVGALIGVGVTAVTGVVLPLFVPPVLGVALAGLYILSLRSRPNDADGTDDGSATSGTAGKGNVVTRAASATVGRAVEATVEKAAVAGVEKAAERVADTMTKSLLKRLTPVPADVKTMLARSQVVVQFDDSSGVDAVLTPSRRFGLLLCAHLNGATPHEAPLVKDLAEALSGTGDQLAGILVVVDTPPRSPVRVGNLLVCGRSAAIKAVNRLPQLSDAEVKRARRALLAADARSARD